MIEAPHSSAHRLRQQLGIAPDWAHRWDTLSHGERKRAQLAVALHVDPVCLAVDEPTNHLDRPTRDLVWQALAAFKGIGLLVSHDRELLDGLCRQCLFLDSPAAVLRPGGYSQGARDSSQEAMAIRREQARAAREVARLRRERVIRREHEAKGERLRSKRGLARGDRDGRAKIDAARVADSGSGQRLRQLDGRLEQAEERASQLRVRRRFDLGISLPGERSRRRFLLHIPEGTLQLADGLDLWLPSLVISPNDRIGIQGPNGSGKSTLVRRIVAELDRAGEQVAYIPQEIDARRSSEILRDFQNLPPDRLGRAMTLVRRLGSDPARLLQSREPSPGELRKLLLAASIEGLPHVVILDEPTNHLDLPSIECLEAALGECASALIMVSHDRRFLTALARRMWCIVPGQRHRWELTQ